MSQPDELRRLLRRLEHQRDKALRAEVKSDELYELYDADNEGHEGEYVAALVTLTSERSELADMATSAVPQFRAAADRIERLEAQQAAALNLHQRCEGGSGCTVEWIDAHEFAHCTDCNEGWPCATRRALTEDTP